MFTFSYTTNYHLLVLVVSSVITLLFIAICASLKILILGLISVFFFLFFINSSLFNDLSSYFYVKYSLKVNVDFSEAQEFSFLFKANHMGLWYPLTEVKLLPKDERKKYIYNFIARLKGEE